ncbi:conserved hypothetical protein [Burkholderia mallei PRL-20]|nr:hypothetical protein BMAFMH_F0037 [Burkholderia mallei FMH]EDP84645.1 hypothetical protein BMA10399_A0600 [Burkholderia mallei ATCC 10399]EEH30460.1 conserved hypothetical protein [Burkholderia pseudomallei Pakistan 9]EEP86571.1 conserved hypothetical protein [Burkholderia mallei GB8 horse 4]EES47013.1 conserved hypothetical protein [Burkholderia mallei PRL-20]KGR93255.1 hypothetical protein X948_5625 [Burkholderia pseudomallei MSHR5608]KGS20017.1 sperm-specific Phi-1 domain protein [Burkh
MPAWVWWRVMDAYPGGDARSRAVSFSFDTRKYRGARRAFPYPVTAARAPLCRHRRRHVPST